MGWTSVDKPFNVKDYIDELHTHETDTEKYMVLDSAIKNMHTYYAAVEVTDKITGKIVVSAAVVLLRYSKSYWGAELSYKAMCESVWPTKSDCPERIMELLTDTENQFTGVSLERANSWRDACWKDIEDRKLFNWALKQVEVGDKLTFNRPVFFVNGKEFTELYVTSKERGRLRFSDRKNDMFGMYYLTRTTLFSLLM